MERDEAITRIRAALKKRSGKTWSVTGGRGTSWGWILITAPPARRVKPYDYLSDEDAAELARLLGLEIVHRVGEQVPASGEHRREYVQRAERGLTAVQAQAYWD